MPLIPSIDLDNEYFRVEHITDTRDVRRAIGYFSAGEKAEGLERYLKELALTDEADSDARTYLVRDVVTNEIAAYFSLRACLVPVPIDGTDIYTIPGIELSNFARNKAYRPTGKRTEKIGICAWSHQAEIRSGLRLHVPQHLNILEFWGEQTPRPPRVAPLLRKTAFRPMDIHELSTLDLWVFHLPLARARQIFDIIVPFP